MPERARELFGLAYVEDLDRRRVFLEPVRIDFPDPGKRISERRPIWFCRHSDAVLGPSTFQIGRHCHIELLGVGEAQVFHVAGKIAFPDFAPQARVEPPFLADAGDRQTAVIVGGIEQA